MPRSKKGSPPAYRLHSSGQARVTVRDRKGNRRDIMLGPWQFPESKAEYQRVLALLTLHNGCYPFPDDSPDHDGITVAEVILAWWKAAERRYGPTSLELDNYRTALRHLRELYGSRPAAQFTPKCLKTVRQRMVDALQYCVRSAGKTDSPGLWLGEDRVRAQEQEARLAKKGPWVKVEVLESRKALSRKVINRHLVRLRAVFSWAVEEELVPGNVAAALREVKGVMNDNYNARPTTTRIPDLI